VATIYVHHWPRPIRDLEVCGYYLFDKK